MASLQQSTGLLLVAATPLLEEERHPGRFALLLDLIDPYLVDWSGARTRLSAGDHPVNASEIYRTERSQQRLE